MKKNIIIYGLLSGVIISILMALNVSLAINSGNFDNSLWLGYGSMLIGFLLIFIAIKNYRDQHSGGLLSFGKAFKIGFMISLIASVIYVIVWLIEEHFFFPGFMEKYMAYELNKLQSSGMGVNELADKTKELDQALEMYNNPALKVLMTFAELFPVGLVVTLISSFILKRKSA